MLAAIMEGEADFADVMFLVAFVLALVAGLAVLVHRTEGTWLAMFALAAIALGLLAL